MSPPPEFKILLVKHHTAGPNRASFPFLVKVLLSTNAAPHPQDTCPLRVLSPIFSLWGDKKKILREKAKFTINKS